VLRNVCNGRELIIAVMWQTIVRKFSKLSTKLAAKR